MARMAKTLDEYLDDIDVVMAVTDGRDKSPDASGVYRYVVTLVNIVCHGHAIAEDFEIKSPKKLNIPLNEDDKQFIIVYILSKILFCNVLLRMLKETKYKKFNKLLKSWVSEYAEIVDSYCKIFTFKETLAIRGYLDKDLLEKYVRQQASSKVGKMFL